MSQSGNQNVAGWVKQNEADGTQYSAQSNYTSVQCNVSFGFTFPTVLLDELAVHLAAALVEHVVIEHVVDAQLLRRPKLLLPTEGNMAVYRFRT